MDKLGIFLSVIFLWTFCWDGCGDDKVDREPESEKFISTDSNNVILEFSFNINSETYQQTNYGEPPQLAIWIETLDSKIIKTTWVTRRAATNDWRGKIECPVALPYWESKIETKIQFNTRGKRNTHLDAVSGATQKEGRFSASILVPRNSSWKYFIEVNASSDYNKVFTYWSKEGLPDSQANGQPSLVYGGRIIADGVSPDIPVLIGRTQQRHAVDSLSNDLSGITTAKHLIEEINVKLRE